MSRANLDTSETIFALATGSLPSAIAVVRLSGPQAFPIAEKIFQSSSPFEKRRGMYFGNLVDTEGKQIDESILTAFVGPYSHTGDDCIEFHCHGSISINRRLEHSLLLLGARPATRGEFSYRAFLNGKVSLEGLEELGDVFLAKDEADLESIYRRKDHSLEKKIAELREQLIKVQAILDTAVDFSEEYASVVSQARQPLNLVIRECSVITQRYELFRTGRNYPRLVLVGRPNAGKSSLFNALLGRYRAIVDPTAGTTRDVIEEDIDIGGRTWRLVDTAGIRQTDNAIERSGILQGEKYLESATAWLLVVDGTQGLGELEAAALDRHRNKPHWIVVNKSDVGSVGVPAWAFRYLSVSAETGDGVDGLWKAIERRLAEKNSIGHGGLLPTATQSQRLKTVIETLAQMDVGFGELPPEYLAEKNRGAIRNLEAVIGPVSQDDVLDRVFGEFCIGK